MKSNRGIIKVLVVDDSLIFRELLARGLATDPSIEVIGKAADPYEAVAIIERESPDVMTCDVEMPRMNGVAFIRKLLPQYALPVIVVSTVSKAILDAMNAGAIDFVTKPNMADVTDAETFLREMIRKVKGAVHSNVRHAGAAGNPAYSAFGGDRGKTYGSREHVIVIGASTGGTEAIQQVLAQLPPGVPGIAVVQHIPPVFSRMFAERLNQATGFRVKEAQTGDVLERGTVLIAPGDRHMRLVRGGVGVYRVQCQGGERVNGHVPSVDVLFDSAAKLAGPKAIGVLLTGMGYDGARGMLAIRRRGGRTIGQDEATSVIYGMPKAAYEVGGVEAQAPLSAIGARICEGLGSS